MRTQELKQLIAEKEKKAEKEKRKRGVIVTAVFAAVYFFMFCLFEGKPGDFTEFFSYLLTSLILSVLNFGIFQAVFEHLFAKEQAAENEIKALKKELNEIEKKE